MEIRQFNSSPPSPLAEFNPVTDAPPAPEMPTEVHVAFSLGPELDRSVKALNRNLENMLRCQLTATNVSPEHWGGGLAEQAMAEFLEQVDAKRIRHQMWVPQVRGCVLLMAHCFDSLSPEQHSQKVAEQDRILNALHDRPVPPEIAEAYDAVFSAPNDFFDKLLELIDLIKNGYLAGYEHIIAAYSDFFKDFNTEITAKMKEWIEGANDGKEIKLNAGQIRLALQALISKYSHPNPASVLFPAPGMEGASKEEAEKWLKALGLPASCLKENADGTFCVVIDLGPLTTMVDNLPPGTWVTWDTAKFQSWQTGFNAQEERMKNMLQSFTQKYSNANSYHDNFNKTLSSHLNQFADMLKAMLNF